MAVLHTSRSRSELYEASGDWWRFDRYEIQGPWIRPAAGAALERYDPWASYAQSKRARSRVAPPYFALIELGRRIHTSSAGRMPLTHAGDRGRIAVPRMHEDDRRALVEWCTQWGLLGILLHFTRSVALAPRWEAGVHYELVENKRTGTAYRSLRPSGELEVTQRTYMRAPNGWLTSTNTRHGCSSIPGAEARDGGLVQRALIPEKWPRPAAVIEHSPAYSKPLDLSESGPLGKRWAEYFPDVPGPEEETHAYPAPLSEEFWRSYAEPIFEFYYHARMLWMIWDNLHVGRPEVPGQAPAEVARERCRRSLNQLLTPVSTVLVEDRSDLRRLRVAPTLLGSLALMILDDVAEKRRVRRCARCKRPFRAAAWAARFCGERCRQTAAQARYRTEQRSKIESRLVGGGVPRAQASRLAARLQRKYQTLVRVQRELSGPGRAAITQTLLGELSTRKVTRTLAAISRAGR